MATEKARKLIWLEDSPHLHAKERSVILGALKGTGINLIHWSTTSTAKDTQQPGVNCLRYFRDETEQAKNSPETIAGFVLDVRIPIQNLSALNLDLIDTQSGINTGLAIAYYYLRNKGGQSLVGDVFKNHPVLMFSIAPKLDKEHPWVNIGSIKYIQKQSPDWDKEISTWISSIC